MTATMQAATQYRYDGAERLTISTVERPSAGPDEVLVEVRAAGLSPGDRAMITGVPYVNRLAASGLLRPKQPIPGYDCAGVVHATGDAVTELEVGDRVFGTLPARSRSTRPRPRTSSPPFRRGGRSRKPRPYPNRVPSPSKPCATEAASTQDNTSRSSVPAEVSAATQCRSRRPPVPTSRVCAARGCSRGYGPSVPTTSSTTPPAISPRPVGPST